MEALRLAAGFFSTSLLVVVLIRLWISLNRRESEMAAEIAMLRDAGLVSPKVAELEVRVAALEKMLSAEGHE